MFIICCHTYTHDSKWSTCNSDNYIYLSLSLLNWKDFFYKFQFHRLFLGFFSVDVEEWEVEEVPEKADGGTKEGGGIPRDSEREEVDENLPPEAAWNLILYCAYKEKKK